MAIMVRSISLIYIYDLLLGFPCLNLFPAQKTRNKTVEAPFFIPGVSTKRKSDLRVKPIVESEIGVLLEFERYSSD